MNILEIKMYHEIESATAGMFSEDAPYITVRENAAEACASISLEYMGLFLEWVRKERFEHNERGWCQPQSSISKTEQQLVQLYLDTLKEQ